MRTSNDIEISALRGRRRRLKPRSRLDYRIVKRAEITARFMTYLGSGSRAKLARGMNAVDEAD